MNYAELKTYDIANGPGVRVTLFVSGCDHHCKGCFNEVAWDYQYGKVFDKEITDFIIERLRSCYIRGLTLLGGEPLAPRNQAGVLQLLREVKSQCPDKDIWCYTGYLYEQDVLGWMMEQCKETKEIISLINVLVDGPYVESMKDITLRFRGSRNQRLIDVPKSLRRGTAVLWDE